MSYQAFTLGLMTWVMSFFWAAGSDHVGYVSNRVQQGHGRRVAVLIAAAWLHANCLDLHLDTP